MNGNLTTLHLIRTLYEYNAWANGRLLDTVAAATPEQFLAAGGPGHESMRDTLVHIMGAQWIWLARWNGDSPSALLDVAAFPDLASIRERWHGIENDTQQFIKNLDVGRLAEEVAYRNTSGQRWVYPLWQQMLHQVNHATQHRSEAAQSLTRLGLSPGDLDLLVYMDAMALGE